MAPLAGVSQALYCRSAIISFSAPVADAASSSGQT